MVRRHKPSSMLWVFGSVGHIAVVQFQLIETMRTPSMRSRAAVHDCKRVGQVDRILRQTMADSALHPVLPRIVSFLLTGFPPARMGSDLRSDAVLLSNKRGSHCFRPVGSERLPGKCQPQTVLFSYSFPLIFAEASRLVPSANWSAS